MGERGGILSKPVCIGDLFIFIFYRLIDLERLKNSAMNCGHQSKLNTVPWK